MFLIFFESYDFISFLKLKLFSGFFSTFYGKLVSQTGPIDCHARRRTFRPLVNNADPADISPRNRREMPAGYAHERFEANFF